MPEEVQIKYLILEADTKKVIQVIRWADNRAFPIEITLVINTQVEAVPVELAIDIGNIYNIETGEVTVIPPEEVVIEPTEIEVLRAELTQATEAINFILMNY